MEHQEYSVTLLRVLWVISMHTKNSQGITKEKLMAEICSFYRKSIFIQALETVLIRLERQECILWRDGVIFISGTGLSFAKTIPEMYPDILEVSKSPRIPMRA